MVITCWSAKGGSGTTVIAAALAAAMDHSAGSTLLVDLEGDLPVALGLAEPEGPGVRGWLAEPATLSTAELLAAEVSVDRHIGLLPAGPRGAIGFGGREPGAARGDALVELLAATGRTVVVDAGTLANPAALAVAASASVSLLVLRPCYLALRRAVAAPLRPSGLVVVREPGRALADEDLAIALGVPVRASVPLDPAVARAVDAGLLGQRVPGSLTRALRRAA